MTKESRQPSKDFRKRYSPRFLSNDDSIFNQKPTVIASALDERFRVVLIRATTKISVKASLLDEMHKLVPQSEHQYNNQSISQNP